MDFTWGFITGIYVVIAIIISYVVYLIEVKLDLPALINGHQSTTPNTQNNNNNNNNNNDNDDFTNISERRLRQLIENIIAETLRVSGLTTGAISDVALNNTQHTTNGLPLTNANGDIRHRHRTEHYFEPKNYQEYLANAVLNKIADKQGNGRLLSESTPDLSAAHVIDRNYNVENQSTTSGSSVEPRSDSSLTDTEQQILTIKKSEGGLSPCGSQQNLRAVDLTALGRDSSLSDYIATHTVPLPDLSAPATESEGDDYVSVTSSAVGVEGTWEDNWLFKKKSSSCAASSVGIVVPSPKEDVRCQIGDKVADEVSDLSELGSDTDDSSIDFLRKKVDPLNDRLLNKHLIGGQNTKLVLDEIIDRASMISNTSVPENEPKYTETKNEYAIQNLNKTEAINSYISQIQTTEGEIKQITQPENLKKPDLGQLKKNDAIGSIAEREYKKWSNAVDMPNNPYAPDALKRRISGSQERFMDLPNISPSTEQNPIDLIKNSNEDDTTTQIEQENRENDKKRYSRDYYINDNNEVSSSSNSPKRSTPTTPTVAKTQLNDDVTLTKSDDIIINEVISNGTPKRTNSSEHRNKNNSDCYWNLSTPMRRSSSLKFINKSNSPRPSKSHINNYINNNNNNYNINNNNYYSRNSYSPPPSTTTKTTARNTINKQYHQFDNDFDFQNNYFSHNNNNDDYNDQIDDDFDDVRSQRSWRSAITTYNSTTNITTSTPKMTASLPRRSISSLSFHSNGSVSGNSSLNSNAINKKRSIPNANILTQFEKQLLHKDLKRNSFRAISNTTKDFVMNPLFESEKTSNKPIDDHTKLTIKTKNYTNDDQVDSGVDSCLNGFSEADAKQSNTSLLF